MAKIEKEGVAFSKTEQEVHLALDLVAEGDGGFRGERVSKTLPEGITSRMLYSDVVRIAWPSLIELTLTQLTAMVDLMMVGRLGPWAITAVGLTVQPKFLLMTMFVAMNVGATALVAQYRGAGEPEKANDILRQGLLLSLCRTPHSVYGGGGCGNPCWRHHLFTNSDDRLYSYGPHFHDYRYLKRCRKYPGGYGL